MAANMMSAAATSSLSARGSRNLPRVVVEPWRRARYTSKMSVRLAIKKVIAAKILDCLPGSVKK